MLPMLKLLGVKTDCKLSFDAQIDDLYKTLSQRIAVLSRIKKFIPLKERMAYYNAMIKEVMLKHKLGNRTNGWSKMQTDARRPSSKRQFKQQGNHAKDNVD